MCVCPQVRALWTIVPVNKPVEKCSRLEKWRVEKQISSNLYMYDKVRFQALLMRPQVRVRHVGRGRWAGTDNLGSESAEKKRVTD